MDHRQEVYEAISEMLDNPDECGIYPTTKCYDRLEVYCNALSTEVTNLRAVLQVAAPQALLILDNAAAVSGKRPAEPDDAT